MVNNALLWVTFMTGSPEFVMGGGQSFTVAFQCNNVVFLLQWKLYCFISHDVSAFKCLSSVIYYIESDYFRLLLLF